MKHLQHSTPALKDKRLGFALFVVVLLAALAGRAIVSGDTAATGIVTVALAYLAQSQAGLTLRARAASAPAATESGGVG